MSGTVELKTDRLLLRRHQSEDAAVLFEIFGSDPQMFAYSGWNPYQTYAMATETVESFIKSCDDPHFYGWGIVHKGKLIGTIGAYDYDSDKSRIEIGMSIERASWGQGFATEAVTVVLRYLTEHENIKTVRAWCADGNIGSRKAMEKAGMKMVRSDKDALDINGQIYDKVIFEYRECYAAKIKENPEYDYITEAEPTPVPHHCPVCGKYVFHDENCFDICSFCGWEDDGADDSSNMIGANGMTFQAFKALYAQRIAADPNYRWDKSHA